TTAGGASSCCGTGGCGTVFKITTGGTLTTLHSFDFADGAHPNAVMQATDGNFYGTAWTGGTSSACGSSGCGTVFKITAAGTLTTLHSSDATPRRRRGVRLWHGFRNYPVGHADHAAQLRWHGRRLPVCRAGASDGRKPLRNNR